MEKCPCLLHGVVIFTYFHIVAYGGDAEAGKTT